MRTDFVSGILFVCCLLLASCSQTGGDGDIADAVVGNIEVSTTDVDGNPYCVIDVAPTAVCTKDINVCGNGSMCACPDGYGYNAALGKCVLELGGISRAVEARLSDGACVKAAASMCTRDINMCGQPSQCSCDEGFIWNSVVGKCLKELGT